MVNKFIKLLKQFLIKLINNITRFLKNEKKEFSKIITEFWIEHDVGNLLIISSFILLIIWILIQAQYYGSMFYIPYDDYINMQDQIQNLKLENTQYKNTIQTQTKEIENLTTAYKHCKKSISASYVSASILLFLGAGSGFIVGVIIASIFK